MAKLTRYVQKLFGSTATANQIAKFGSLAAGSPARYSGSTINPDLVQALGNYLSGWNGAVVGSNSPAIEDMNALCYLFAYQLSYLMQEGVAEWDSATTYYIGSVVNNGSGVLYVSIVDNNLNNVVTDTSKWTPAENLLANSRTRTVTTNGTDPGVGGVVYSSSCSSFSTSSTSFVDVTNLSVTLTTSGRPVFVGLVQDAGATIGSIQARTNSAISAPVAEFKLLVGSTSIAYQLLTMNLSVTSSSYQLTCPSSSLNTLYATAAGTYTFKAQAKAASGCDALVQYSKLIAYEI